MDFSFFQVQVPLSLEFCNNNNEYIQEFQFDPTQTWQPHIPP